MLQETLLAAWRGLEPFPDALLDGIQDAEPGPEARYEARETIALAFVAAVQHLPPRQRAVLLLRDVLGFRAAEVAGMLDSTEISVNSALQRARATLAARLPAPGREAPPQPRSARERRLVERFAAAFTSDDIDGLVGLLTAGARYSMPPATLEYEGPEAIAAFLRQGAAWRSGRPLRLVPTSANGQPAFGSYLRDPSADVYHAHGLIVLTLAGDRISAITRFLDSAVLAQFGLPTTL